MKIRHKVFSLFCQTKLVGDRRLGLVNYRSGIGRQGFANRLFFQGRCAAFFTLEYGDGFFGVAQGLFFYAMPVAVDTDVYCFFFALGFTGLFFICLGFFPAGQTLVFCHEFTPPSRRISS